MYDLVIIGAGPAGIFAATCAAMNNLNAVVIESSYEIGGQLNLYKEKAVYDMPGFRKIMAGDLVDQFYNQYLEYESMVPLHLDTQAISLEGSYGNFKLMTNKGLYETKTILLANGGGMFQPKKLDLNDADQVDNIYYSVQKLDALKDLDVVILGGGDSAVDWGLSLEKIAKSITIVHRRDEFRAHEQNVDRFKAFGKTYTPYIPDEIIGKNHATHLVIKHVETDEKIKIKTDAILVFYGASPVRNKIDQWKVNVTKLAINVETDMRTSREGIYAVGNSIGYEGKLKMIVTALGESATAIGAITKLLHPEKTMTYKH